MKFGFLILILWSSISVYAVKPTSGDEKRSISDVQPTPVSRGQYITGGVVGSLFGFGVGHAIQGRYLERGYIFTIGETVLPFILSPLIYNLTTTSSERNKCVDFCGFTGFLAISLGFKVWEIYSLWWGARPVDQSSKEVFLFFDPHDTKLGFKFTF